MKKDLDNTKLTRKKFGQTYCGINIKLLYISYPFQRFIFHLQNYFLCVPLPLFFSPHLSCLSHIHCYLTLSFFSFENLAAAYSSKSVISINLSVVPNTLATVVPFSYSPHQCSLKSPTVPSESLLGCS